MKNFIAIVLSMICVHLYAQDFIVLKTGTEVKTKVIEVTPTEIKYRLFENLDGPLITINKSDAILIRYSNGTNEIINTTIPSLISTEMAASGKRDAEKNYDPGSAGLLTGATTILFGGIIGLIPAIVCSSSIPKEQNLHYPDTKLIQNPVYENSYKSRAKSMKQSSVWTSFGIACVANIAIVILITTSK